MNSLLEKYNEDIYVKKYLKKIINNINNLDNLSSIINKIYEEGYQDGVDNININDATLF